MEKTNEELTNLRMEMENIQKNIIKEDKNKFTAEV